MGTRTIADHDTICLEEATEDNAVYGAECFVTGRDLSDGTTAVRIQSKEASESFYIATETIEDLCRDLERVSFDDGGTVRIAAVEGEVFQREIELKCFAEAAESPADVRDASCIVCSEAIHGADGFLGVSDIYTVPLVHGHCIDTFCSVLEAVEGDSGF